MRPVLPAVLISVLLGCSGGGGDGTNVAALGDSDTPPTTPGAIADTGLDQRPDNIDCVAPPRPSANADVNLVRAFPALRFSLPVGLVAAPGNRWVVLEKAGQVHAFDNDDSVAAAQLVLDLRSRVDAGPGEAGLLGLAFHPRWSENGRVFISYTAPGNPLVSRISEFSTQPPALTIDPGSERVLLSLDQPYGNHNGGHLAFGPDGYLYAGFGDGGSAGDPHNNGQNPGNLFASLIRIGVDGAQPYTIPPDNPYANGGGRGEVWAYGLRNPWRFSFDPADGTLWAADVGQAQWEEVNIITRGGNYGWSIREGAHCFQAGSCRSEGLIDPVAEYSHDQGCSITGGHVYRGGTIPPLAGTYVYGDFCSGRVWGLFEFAQGQYDARLLADSGISISAFGQDAAGEIYLTDYGSGGIHRLVPSNGNVTAFPQRLSASGCADPADPRRGSSGMIDYGVNAPLWSDGAAKQRWLAIPNGTAIDLTGDGHFELPVGSVVRKDFSLNGQRVETRLMIRHDDGGWAGYSYAWSADQRDAWLLNGAQHTQVQGQTWFFPSRAQCFACHTGNTRLIGLETLQLNRLYTYAHSARTANQLATFAHLQLLTTPQDPASTEALAPPRSDAPVATRARAYLHTNCAQCHRSGGSSTARMDLSWHTPLAATGTCDAIPQLGDLGIADARIIAPGAPERSVLLARMARRDLHAMPPLASNRVDEAGVTLVRAWISELKECP